VASEFDRARMQMQDRLLRDGRLSSSARLVGVYLLGRVNRATGCAWPASNTVAADLHVSLRTVKNATAKLDRLEYFRIERNVRGGSNHYFPRFERSANSAPLSSAETSGAEKTSEESKKEHARGAENVPQSLLKNSLRTPSTDCRSKCGAAGSIQRQQGSGLRARKGDERLERQLSEAFGPDGDEILGTLHSMDGGRPYYRLIAAARRGEVSQSDLHAARLAKQHSAVGLRPQILPSGDSDTEHLLPRGDDEILRSTP
jgi:hypothetical protein